MRPTTHKDMRLPITAEWKARVVERMESLRWSRADLAREAGLDKTVIGAILDRQTVSSHVRLITEVLEIDMPSLSPRGEIQRRFDRLAPDDQDTVLALIERLSRPPQ